MSDTPLRALIRDGYSKGLPTSEISKITGSLPSTIRHLAHLMGIRHPTRRERRKSPVNIRPYTRAGISDEDRWFRVWVMTEPNSGCWLWTGAMTKKGYGYAYDGKDKILAHRYSYKVHKGDLPSDMLVCHKCDNPACVNPDHLFLGTNLDNALDKIAKGRAVKSIPPEAVLEIYQSKKTRKSLAERYGISVGYVSAIRQGKVRRYLTNG